MSAFDFDEAMFGKVVGHKKRRPVRLTPSELHDLTARAAQIRSLINHAKEVGFAFDDDDRPECELARIKNRLAEHRHKGMIVEEVREGGLNAIMDSTMVDMLFDSNPIFQRGWTK